MSEPTVAVVIGSTRPGRICPKVSAWACEVLTETGLGRYELLDLATFDLPLLDEPIMASRGEYEFDHTRRWSQTISGYAGFLFVFPQYNWGYPAVLKNALDYLYAEWRGKPATTLTYGTRGGAKGADQLQQVLNGLHMLVLDARIEVPIPATDVDSEGQLIDPNKTLTPVRASVESVAQAFKAALR